MQVKLPPPALAVAAFALAVALTGTATAAAMGTRSSGASSNSVTYADSAGEDAAAPDITSVVVSNDDSGVITFQINVPNRPQLTPDMGIVVALDTDQNPKTGAAEYEGAEYGIFLDIDGTQLEYWNGSRWDASVPQSTLTYAYANGATLRINAADLGKVNAFNFWLGAGSNFDTATPHVDWAPDIGHGTWAYKLGFAPQLAPETISVSPKRPRAGAQLVASLPVAVVRGTERGQLPDTAQVTCTAALAGKRLAGHGTAVGGVAECAWTIPSSAKGKTFRGSITVTLEGVTASRAFSTRIG